MLSILIPVYNFDTKKFVSELHRQCIEENIDFEIILADDASDNSFIKLNSELKQLSNVNYIQLEENIGRSKIRNLLAEKAKFDYLLFADCDMQIQDNNFIKKYINELEKNVIICGGISYSEKQPESKFFFRWYYGIKREKQPAQKRKINPYASFMTGNFLIKKSVFQKIKFNENITKYGHEDTLFGIELKRKNIKIHHIDNPLIHIGLEDASTFIQKTENGIINLIKIKNEFNYPELSEEIKLLRTAVKLRFLKPFIILFFNVFKNGISRNLKSGKPKLFLFDFFNEKVH